MSKEQLLFIPVVGSLTLFMSRLDEEYNKSLQRTNPHTVEYVVRLRDEPKLVDLLRKGQKYQERIGAKEDAAQLALLRLEHLYYRHDSIAEKVDRASKSYNIMGEVISDAEEKSEPIDYEELIETLCVYVYQFGSDRNKTRAMLCHIYHHALHNRFLEARDLLLMSHLQDNISNVGDISTMILFNRMMVTLGLSAFRQGRIKDAHQCLSEVCSGRVRELLAQGINTGRFAFERSVEEEKAEKRRQIPYHQHINLDLLEACHLISAMLLEVPNMAAAGDDPNRRTKIISRTFRKNHDNYDRQVFTGPPEQTRDFVMRASKALMRGDWRTCADLILNLEAWKLIPGDDSVQQIHSMLLEKIKLEGLRTYLFAFSSHYDSLSLSQLCGMFQMNKNEIHSIVSKMMINQELHATWDQLTETIVLRRVEPSNLQLLALQFAEKAATLVDANERLLDAKSGNYFHRDSEGYWKSGGGGGEQRDGGRGGNQQSNMRRTGAPSGRIPSGRGVSGRGRGGRGRGGMNQQGGRRSRA
jgi:translation initiation factor 3 subunit C